VRHGLTAETVIPNLEDGEDYKAFEATAIADYCAETAVARELVLRLASLLCAFVAPRGVPLAGDRAGAEGRAAHIRSSELPPQNVADLSRATKISGSVTNNLLNLRLRCLSADGLLRVAWLFSGNWLLPLLRGGGVQTIQIEGVL
jgi:hypothetical protein